MNLMVKVNELKVTHLKIQIQMATTDLKVFGSTFTRLGVEVGSA